MIPWLDYVKRNALEIQRWGENNPEAGEARRHAARQLALVAIAEAAQLPCTGGDWRIEELNQQALADAVDQAGRVE